MHVKELFKCASCSALPFLPTAIHKSGVCVYFLCREAFYLFVHLLNRLSLTAACECLFKK